MKKLFLMFLVSSLLFLVSCNNQNKLESSKDEKIVVDSLNRKIDTLKTKLANCQRPSFFTHLNDTIRIKNIQIDQEERIHPAKIIDYTAYKRIPRDVLDTLQAEYPYYYFPKANRCRIVGMGDLIPSENPLYVSGDFNGNQNTDHAFIIESYGLGYRGSWVHERRLVILLSITGSQTSKTKYKFIEKHIGSGLGISIPINSALGKLDPKTIYYYRNKKIEVASEKLLYISSENEVGYLFEWENNNYVMNILWNTL